MSQSNSRPVFRDAFKSIVEDAVSKTSSVAFRDVLACTFLNRLEIRADDRNRRHFQPCARVIILSDKTERTAELVQSLKALGMAPLVVASGYDHLAVGDLTFNHFAQYCIIDAEHVAKQTNLFNFCTELRKKSKEVPVILTSSTFVVDDMSRERSQLCDASLSDMFTLESLQSVLSSATSNNLATRLSASLTT